MLETSIFIKLLRKVLHWYSLFMHWLGETKNNSRVNKTIENLLHNLPVSVKYSYLGKIAEINRNNNITIFEGSTVANWVANLYYKSRDKIFLYLKTSRIISLIVKLNRGFYIFPFGKDIKQNSFIFQLMAGLRQTN